MRRTFALTAVLLAAVQLAPIDGLAQKKKDKDNGGVKATPQEYLQIHKAKELVGKVGVASDDAVSLQIEYPQMAPNPAFKAGGLPMGAGGQNLNRLYQEVARDYQEIARAKNPLERRRKMQELQRDMQSLQMEIARASGKGAYSGKGSGPFNVVTDTKEFDLDLADNVVVRWANLPFEYDDKGEVKKFTKQEIAEMKGTDAKLPGYNAKLDNLSPGQTVKLFLKAPAKQAKADEPAGAGNVARPTVTMIVILQESNLPVASPRKGKK